MLAESCRDLLLCVACGNNNSCLLSDKGRGAGGGGTQADELSFVVQPLALKTLILCTRLSKRPNNDKRKQRKELLTYSVCGVDKRLSCHAHHQPRTGQDSSASRSWCTLPYPTPASKSIYIMLFLAEPQLNSICANECAHHSEAETEKESE